MKANYELNKAYDYHRGSNRDDGLLVEVVLKVVIPTHQIQQLQSVPNQADGDHADHGEPEPTLNVVWVILPEEDIGYSAVSYDEKVPHNEKPACHDPFSLAEVFGKVHLMNSSQLGWSREFGNSLLMVIVKQDLFVTAALLGFDDKQH